MTASAPVYRQPGFPPFVIARLFASSTRQIQAVIGGLGTLAVVGAWMGLFPVLRRVDRIEDVSDESEEALNPPV